MEVEQWYVRHNYYIIS